MVPSPRAAAAAATTWPRPRTSAARRRHRDEHTTCSGLRHKSPPSVRGATVILPRVAGRPPAPCRRGARGRAGQRRAAAAGLPRPGGTVRPIPVVHPPVGTGPRRDERTEPGVLGTVTTDAGARVVVESWEPTSAASRRLREPAAIRAPAARTTSAWLPRRSPPRCARAGRASPAIASTSGPGVGRVRVHRSVAPRASRPQGTGRSACKPFSAVSTTVSTYSSVKGPLRCSQRLSTGPQMMSIATSRSRSSASSPAS